MNKTMTLLLLLSLGLCLTNLAWGNTNSTSSDTLPPQLIQRKAPGTRLVSNAVLLQASGGDEYQWSTGATTSSINIETPTSPQKYSVHIKRRKTHQNWVLQQIVYPEQIDKNQSIAQFGCQNLGLSWQSSVCAGASVTIHATGGNSYEWDTGETTSSITVFPTNGKVYTVKITGIDDCNVTLSTASAPMVVIPVPDAKITVSNNECSAIGAILTASGGEAYLWAGGQTTQSIVTDEAVLYEVKVSNGNGLCTDTESIWVTTNFKPEISGEAQLCQGQGTTLTASGGNTYLWANGATNSSITVLPSDVGTHTYKVQVTAGICSREVSRTITVKAKPTATILGPDKTCNNGSVTLTSSGTGTYKWSTGATTSSINLSLLQSNQTYGLTITDPITKCSSADEHVVNVLPKPTLNDIPNSICAGASVNLSVSGGSSYSWNVGGTTASIVHSPSEFTEYRVTVTDANGCVYSLSKIVNVEALPRITFGGETSICAGQSLNVTAFGGQSYRWDYNNSKTATITVSPTQNTTYTVTATSAGGCTSSAQRVIQVKTPATGAIVGASSICPGQSLILTASGVGTYRWSENNATTSSIQVSPSQNTTYSLLITNAEGCTFQTSHSVSVNLTGSASNDGPLTCSKTTALLQANTGAAGASFSWRNASGVEIASSANTSVNTPGVYSLVITGAGGCSYTTATEVLVNRVNPSMTLSQNGPITCTKPNVVLSASPSTPGASYAWQWRNSAGTVLGTAASIGVSQPGVYTLRATDTNGCTAEQSLSVGADVTPPVLSTVSNDGPLSCTKTNVVLSASSSTPGVTFTWKNAGGTPLGYNASTSVSTVGTYVVEVQGSNGCKISQSTQVGQTGTFPNISVNQPAPISCTNPQTWVSGGSNTAGVTYEWRNANNRVVATQSGFNAQMPGEYTLKVTAPNGCSSSSLVMVEDEVWVSFDWLVDGKAINFWENANYQSRSITCSKSSVSVGLPGSNSSNGTFVLITPQGSSLNLYPGNTRTLTLPGAYRLEMTQSGCTRRKELLIVEDRTPPVVKIEGNTELCGSGSTTLLASGGNKYKWSTGATTASLALGTLSSTSSYTVTVTGLNGCTASKPATVNIHPIPQATPQHAGAFCLDAGQLAVGTLAVSASGGTAPYSYRWDNGQSTAGVLVSSPSSLSMGVTVTDSKACSATATAELVVNRRPYAQILGGEMACAGESPTLTASGGSTFLWSNNATSSSIAISQPTQNQTYSVTVSNVPGCVGFASKTVVVPAALSVEHTLAGTDDCVANNAQVIPSLSGGTGNITLSLFRSGEVEPLPSLNGLKSGTYLLKAQDSKGCTAQREVVIAETPIEISSLTLSKVDDCIPGNTQLNISTKGDRLPLVYRLDGVVQSGATITLPREERTYSIEVSDAAGCVVSREEYYEDYDAVRVYEHNISPVTDCSTPNGALHFHYVGKPGSEQKDYSISVDGGTTWHTNTNLVLNLRPGIYQTAARNDQAGCVVQGPQVQITAPDCLPEAGFTKSTLHITSPTQRIALPWRVDKRAWGNADKPFSLRIYRVEDGKPHFVDPNIATATEPLEKSVEPGAGFTIEYAVDFEGSDERELVLQPNAADHLEPGFYTFLMEGEGVDVDPFRKKIMVIVDLDGRVIVTPVDICPGTPVTLKSPDGECYYWEDMDPSQRNNQEVIIDQHLFGKTYTVHRLINLKVHSHTFTDKDIIRLPYKLEGPKQACKDGSVQVTLSPTQPQQDVTGWTFEWKNDPSKTGFTFTIPKIQETQTITAKLTDPKGCTYEISHTVEVLNLEKNLKITPHNSIVCKGTKIQLKVEGTTPVTSGYYSYNWFFTGRNPRDNSANLAYVPNKGATTELLTDWFGKFETEVKFVFEGGQCIVGKPSTEVKEKTANTNLCDIKSHFENSGYFAIPVELSRPIGVTQPEQRSTTNACDLKNCPATGICTIDETGLSVKIKSDLVSSMGDHQEGLLNIFNSEFGYSTGQALVTKNDDLCSCENALKDLDAAFSSSALGFRIHLFEHQKAGQAACGNTDYLFIKAKNPSGRIFPAGDQEKQYLELAYNYLTNDLVLSGSKAYDELCALMLDNRMSPADPGIFAEANEAATVVETNPCSPYAFSDPICMTPSAIPMRLPAQSVLRFRWDSKYSGLKPQGALTGFTELLSGRKVKYYEAVLKNPTAPSKNDYVFYGYKQLGGFIWGSKERGAPPYNVKLHSGSATGGGILVKSYLYTPKPGTILPSEGLGKVVPDVMVNKAEWKDLNETRQVGGFNDFPGPPSVALKDITNDLAEFYYYQGEKYDGYGFYVTTSVSAAPTVRKSHYVYIKVNRSAPYDAKIYVFNPLDCFYYELEGADLQNFDFNRAYQWAVTIRAITSKDFGQGLLDAAGIVLPIADVVNGLIYLADGNLTNAAISFISVIPIVDLVVKGGVIVAKTAVVTGASVMVKQLLYKGTKYFVNVAKHLNDWQLVYNLTADEALTLLKFANSSDEIFYLLAKNPDLCKVWKEGVANGLDDNALKLLFKDMENNGNFLLEMAARPQMVKTWKLVKEMGSDLRGNIDVIKRLTDDLGKEGLEAFLKIRGKSGLAAWNILDGAKKCFN